MCIYMHVQLATSQLFIIITHTEYVRTYTTRMLCVLLATYIAKLYEIKA